MAKKEMIVKCPQCSEKFNYYESEFRPFCREKCQQIDLGHWLTESYAVPSQSPLSERDLDQVLQEHEEQFDKDH